MGHLFRRSGAKYAPWSIGFASFLTGLGPGQHHFLVGVACRIGDMVETDLALLDTAAEWSVIGRETAILLDGQLGEPTETITMLTARYGRIEGGLCRLKITLIAESGNDLSIEGTVLVSDRWGGPTVLGYRGFLDRIHIALDPGVVLGNQIFFFGAE